MENKNANLDGLKQMCDDAIRGEVTRRLSAPELQRRLFEAKNDPERFEQIWRDEVNELFDELASRYRLTEPSKPFLVEP